MPSPPSVVTREPFLDIARVVAVVGMIATHATNALLSPEFKVDATYHAWRFATGLVAPMFLVLAGFLFARGVARQGSTPQPWAWARTLRAVSYVALGYVLHWPVRDWIDWASVSEVARHRFLQVDILQLMGLGLILLQIGRQLLPQLRTFHAATGGLAIAVACATPLVATIPWSSWLPEAVASYVWQETSALFPVFPWLAYLLAGAAVAGLAGTRETRLAGAATFWGLGTTLLAAGVGGDWFGPEWLTGLDYWRTSPLLVAVRLGCVLVILGLACALAPPPAPVARAMRTLAERSLLVYVLHVVLIYGSVFTFGLQRHFGATLSPGAVAIVTLGLTGLCWGVAWVRGRFLSGPTARRRARPDMPISARTLSSR